MKKLTCYVRGALAVSILAPFVSAGATSSIRQQARSLSTSEAMQSKERVGDDRLGYQADDKNEQDNQHRPVDLNRQLQVEIGEISFNFGGAIVNFGEAQSRCPDSFGPSLECMLTNCPDFATVCENSGFTEMQDPAQEMISSNTTNTTALIIDCDDVSSDICRQFNAEGCCLSDCASQFYDLVVCLNNLDCMSDFTCDLNVDEGEDEGEGFLDFDLDLSWVNVPGFTWDPIQTKLSCPIEWGVMSACVFTECSNYNMSVCGTEANEGGGIGGLEQNPLTNLTCNGLASSICDEFIGEGCCLSSCALEMQTLTLCQHEATTRQALQCDEAPSCHMDTDGTGTVSNGFLSENFEDFFNFSFSGNPFDTDLIEKLCPNEWGDFVGCAALQCPAFLLVCAQDLSTYNTNQTTLDCSTYESAFCNQPLIAQPECCLRYCISQLHELYVCTLKATPEQDLTTCEVPDCGILPNATTVDDSDEDFPSRIFNYFNMSTLLGVEADDAFSTCPTRWVTALDCVIGNCMNAMDVCLGGELDSQSVLNATEVGYCDYIESNLCGAFSGEECCMTKCLQPVLDAALCVVQGGPEEESEEMCVATLCPHDEADDLIEEPSTGDDATASNESESESDASSTSSTSSTSSQEPPSPTSAPANASPTPTQAPNTSGASQSKIPLLEQLSFVVFGMMLIAF